MCLRPSRLCGKIRESSLHHPVRPGVTHRRVRHMNDRMVWIDCEMTGLSLSDDALIEVAALVTDSELNVLGEGVDIVIRPPERALETMPEVVRAMHTASGLLDELPNGTTLKDAEERVLAYIREHVKEPGKAPLCGNSVGTDRGFLLRDMPTLENYLHYRIVDVSSVKELARRWYRGRTSTARRRTATTGRSPTSASPSRSCATTARRSSCRSRDPTPTPRRRSRRSTSCLLSRGAEGARGGRAERRARAPLRTLYTFSRPVGEVTDLPETGRGGCSSAGRAPGCGPGCRGFKSRHSPSPQKPVTSRRSPASGMSGAVAGADDAARARRHALRTRRAPPVPASTI